MRTFPVYPADGPQNRGAVLILTEKAQLGALSSLDDGEYNVRDALGGLRFRVEVKGSKVRLIDRTATVPTPPSPPSAA